MTYEEYVQAVAEKLGRTAKDLDVYGDQVRDSFDIGDSVKECADGCRFEDEEWADAGRRLKRGG